METVVVYQFKTYDAHSDEWIVSKRWGTLDGIGSVKGTPILKSQANADPSQVGVEIEGLTARGFTPHLRQGGFQREVKP